MSNRVRGLRHTLTLAILAVVALVFAAGASAQTTFPATPTNLSKTTTSTSSFPGMVVDAKGNINVAWVDSTAGVIFSRSTNGGPFANVPVGAGSAGAAFQPQIVVDPTGNNVYIAWAAAAGGGNYNILASVSTTGGAANSFSAPKNLTALPGMSPVPLKDGPRMALQSGGGVVVVWGEDAAYASTSPDGMNFTAAQISLANTPQDSGGPRVAVSPTTRAIYIVWTDSLAGETGMPTGNFCTPPPTLNGNGQYTNKTGGHFYFSQAAKGAAPSAAGTRDLSSVDWAGANNTIDPRFPLGFYGCSFDNINLLLDQNGSPHLLWSDEMPDEDVLSSATGTINSTTGLVSLFTFPINLASTTAASPDGYIDSTGNIYAVWSGGAGAPSAGITLRVSNNDGGSYNSAVAVSAAGDTALFPKVSVDANGNVNVVWEQEDQTLAPGGPNTFDVYYGFLANKGQGAPAVAKVSAASSQQCVSITTTLVTATCGSVQLGLNANGSADVA